MERPNVSAPKAVWETYASEVLEVDPAGLTKAELVALADADRDPAGEPSEPVASVDITSQVGPERRIEVFSGPTLELHLTQTPVPDSVTVRDGDRDVPTHVTGSTVRRVGGHFGRGHNRWHVTYTPA